VCFRYRPAAVANLSGQPDTERRLEAWNREILERVNASGTIYLSATRLGGRFTLRVALGNLRTGPGHVEHCWKRLREAARGLDTRSKSL
jgi:aromatic-L-amino-acid decarboxylase